MLAEPGELQALDGYYFAVLKGLPPSLSSCSVSDRPAPVRALARQAPELF